MGVSAQSFSVQAPDIVAAIQLASSLSQAGCDVRVEPQTDTRYRVLGTAGPGPRAVHSLVTAWVERDQICCVELVVGDERQVLGPRLLAVSQDGQEGERDAALGERRGLGGVDRDLARLDAELGEQRLQVAV
jgi:hypothetical protein